MSKKIIESFAIDQIPLNIHLDTEDTEGPTSPENSPINKFSSAFFRWPPQRRSRFFCSVLSCKLQECQIANTLVSTQNVGLLYTVSF